MSTKRPHFKSRTGCSECRNRKIKCDERKPSCYNCERYKSSCSFLQYIPLLSRPQHPRYRTIHQSVPKRIQSLRDLKPPSRLQTPDRGLDSLPLQFTALDLELLHFYTSKTSNEILGHHLTGTHVWQIEVVTISFQHPFLLHELFSLTALHLAYTNTSNPTLCQKYQHAATLYYIKSISSFRNEVKNITRENSEACYACAALLGLHAWAVQGERGTNLFFNDNKKDSGTGAGVPWYKIHRGANQVLKSAFFWIQGSPLWDMIRPWMSLSLWDNPPLKSDEKTNLDALAGCWSDSDLRSEDKIALDNTLQTLRRIFSMVSLMDVEISPSTATLSWATLVPRKFCEMIEEKCPQALVLVATYCILLKRLEEFWWIRGKAEDLFEAVKRELGDGSWDQWLEWAKRELKV